jgi:hypothetical protein
VVVRIGDVLDQLPTEGGLGRPAAAPQPGQHRQRDRPVQERQVYHDRGDHEGVAAGRLAAVGGSLVTRRRPSARRALCARTAEHCVVDRDHHRGPGRNQPADDEAEHHRRHLVGAPPGGGEEPVRPAVMPHRAIPAPVSIAHTVRPAGAATSPATSTTNVSKPGAVKHGRNGSTMRINDPGRLPTEASAALSSKRHYGNRRCFLMP